MTLRRGPEGARRFGTPHAGRRFRALGTTVSLLAVDPSVLSSAEEELRAQLAELEACCSRFQPSSELSRAERVSGRTVAVSELLVDLLQAAFASAELTDGAVDPTVGAAMDFLGYDRDFDDVAVDGPERGGCPVPAPGWRCIDLDPVERHLRIPPGVHVDLGSSAKAFAADRAARKISALCGTGVLVNLGGDISVAGEPPAGGWAVGLALDAGTDPHDTGSVVAIRAGGLASSGTSVRSWRRGGRTLHHIVDPRTGDVAQSSWALVTVAGPTCLVANAASTAAIVEGENASAMLARMGLPSRLVARDGAVLNLSGWPDG
ncbi:MAG TPA: FAD:protein FMN transferase [Acidimicrobiales bacterium]|nr:FAD:protein FMN transferase [Acidimicrobiales bacterium]